MAEFVFAVFVVVAKCFLFERFVIINIMRQVTDPNVHGHQHRDHNCQYRSNVSRLGVGTDAYSTHCKDHAKFLNLTCTMYKQVVFRNNLLKTDFAFNDEYDGQWCKKSV